MAEFEVRITGGTEEWDGGLEPLGADELDRAAAAVRALLAPLAQREAEIMRALHESEMAGYSVDRDAAERWRDIWDAAELAAHRAATGGRADAARVHVSVRIVSAPAP